MVYLTRLNGDVIVVNAGAIDFVEPTPDTRITMASGRWVMVRESVAAVVAAVTAYCQATGRPDAGPRNRAIEEVSDETRQRD